jgi:hypothetical protein
LKDDINVIRNGIYTNEPEDIQYFRGEARSHYLVAVVGWQL